MYIENLKGRFPSYLNDDIEVIEKTIDLSSKHESYIPFDIKLEGNNISIPQRIYSNEGQLNKLKNLTEMQKEIVYCLYSRHHNGFVREYCLKRFISSNNTFTTPYIFQLLGEYIIEIIDVIFENREVIHRDNLIAYISENPAHYQITKQRIYSYWNYYYRMTYPKYSQGVKYSGYTYLDYPGIKMMKYLNELLLIKE